MGMIYLVRKKLFQTKEGAKQLYYAVQRTLQPRGGVTEDILAKRIAHRTGRSEGDVKGILADLPHFIEEALKNGESVSIKGLGSFHIAITSEGFEHPEDVMPGTVRISRVYFTADRGIKQGNEIFPLSVEQILPGKYVEQESCGSGKEGGTARRISGRRDN